MRAFKIISILLLFDSLILCSFSSARSLEKASNKVKQIQARIEDGDQSALEEAAKLPIKQAVSLLQVYALDTANKARAEQAQKVLRDLPGLSGYMKQQLLELRMKPAGEYEMDKNFDLLEVIGGNVAATAVAPFLFVDDPPVLLSEDMSTLSIKVQALYALANMHLPDRPMDKEYYHLNDADEEAWKEWAIKKGYKDNSIPRLMTFEEKGVPPQIIARTEAALVMARAESQVTSQATVIPQSTPLLSASTPRLSVTATPAAAGEKPASEPGFPIVPLAILTTLIAGAAVFLLRRKS